MDYGAIGTVTNLAARLCGEAAGVRFSCPPASPKRSRASSTPTTSDRWA
jgi:hypothetical protein